MIKTPILNIFQISDYDTSIDFINWMSSKNQKVITIECEFGQKQIDENMEGVELSLNHHLNNGVQPSLAFGINLEKYSREHIVITHVDADTIFGIGWVSGIFEKTSEFRKVSYIVSKIDIYGFHNVISMLTQKERELIEVIYSNILSIKHKVNSNTGKIKRCNYILKTLNKIKSYITGDKDITPVYKKLQKSMNNYLDTDDFGFMKELSTEKIHVFTKRINNFSMFNAEFIINYNMNGGTVSIFGRDRETIQKYFPNGLGEVMANFFKGGGGQFGAAASGRRKVVVPLEFFWFLMNLKAIIK